jgi:hypothetical protein
MVRKGYKNIVGRQVLGFSLYAPGLNPGPEISTRLRLPDFKTIGI